MAKEKIVKNKTEEKPKEILYHYCSNNAFHSIIENRSIRLSSLSLSNDFMEGKLVAEIIERIAKADGLDESAMNLLQRKVSNLEQALDGLGFCLSEEGDLLSQWRGYAADATGVSIGFFKPYLKQFAKTSCEIPGKSGFSLNRVEYEPKRQERLIKPTYKKIKELMNEEASENLSRRTILNAISEDEIKIDNETLELIVANSLMAVLRLFPALFSLKTNAFREEKEWRLISPFIKMSDAPCSFQAFSNCIIPFREFEMLELKGNPIVEVILGPKNATPDYVIESLLKQSGFPEIKVLRSKASYR